MFGRKKSLKRPLKKSKIVDSDSDFATIEAFKLLRTNLMFSTPAGGCKKIVITSSIPDEGKSTVSANLAVVLSQMKERVLLIDCDMRSPTLHRFFAAKGLPGISEVLAGMKQADEAMVSIGATTLKLIPAGTVPPNPAELLGSDKMEKLIAELSGQFDYILIDTPPVNMVSDAINLANKVDGYIVLAQDGVTEHKHIRRTLDTLEFANAKVLGLVLNGSKTARESYGAYGKYGQYGR